MRLSKIGSTEHSVKVEKHAKPNALISPLQGTNKQK